jgi:uncharacterized membrane protein YdfJ with MMPL/SSD domain
VGSPLGREQWDVQSAKREGEDMSTPESPTNGSPPAVPADDTGLDVVTGAFGYSGRDGRQAVITGTGQSARVVTAAALIMAVVFASFILTPDPYIKAIGFSFAVGVLVDAFVVRLTLVPAAMAIIGERVWYHPRWYARRIPDPDIEGEKLERQPAAATAAEPAST